MDRLDWGINGLQNCKAQGSMAKVIYPSGYEQEQVPSLRGRLKPLPPWVRLLLQTPGRSSETLLALGTLLGLRLESEQYGV